MPETKRLYVEPSLEKEQMSAHGIKYYREDALSAAAVENHIVLPLRQERVDVRGAKFLGGIVNDGMEFYAPSAHIHDLDCELGSLKEGYAVDLSTVVSDERTVIWGGVLFDHFGHFCAKV